MNFNTLTLIYIPLLLLSLFISSCKKEYINQQNYEISIGQTFTLYVGENSCCVNCWLNENNLHSVTLLERKLVDPAPEDCEGCTSHYAWIFKGTAVGQDTIKIVQVSAGEGCIGYSLDSTQVQQDYFLVNVKN